MSDASPRDTVLDSTQRHFLRELAWRTIAAAARGHELPGAEPLARELGIALEGELARARGAFVTITRGGRLRGCIGYIQGIKPLFEAVRDNARSAAVGDPRFPPLTEDELEGLEWEISALTPLRKVGSPDEIRIGEHGVLLSCQGRQSVFLPQVAIEQGWDVETTLDQLALKAGLAPGAWRAGAGFQVFSAEIF